MPFGSTGDRCFCRKQRLVAILFFYFLFFAAGSVTVFCAQKSEQEDGLWWETLRFTARGSDQATSPAPDLLPYKWVKERAGELLSGISKFSRLGAIDAAPSLGTSGWTYRQVDNSLINVWRDRNVQGVRDYVRRNYPRTPTELGALENRGGPPGGRDVAVVQGQLKPIRAPRLTFAQVAEPVLKKQLDPNDHVGKLKLLNTLQALQHLINCQAQGQAVTQCAKDYGLSFAMSKAVMELLATMGQQLGWHFLKDAALGELIVGSTATIGYLAYADYVAIQEIHALLQELSKSHEDALSNQRMAEHNAVAGRENWDGSMRGLQIRLDLFRQQFDKQLLVAGEDLFQAWGDADESYLKARSSREALGKALDSFLAPAWVQQRLAEFCRNAGEAGARNGEAALRDELRQALMRASQCGSLREAGDLWSVYVQLDTKLRLLPSYGPWLALLDDARQARELQTLYGSFDDTYQDAVMSAWAARMAYEDYRKTLQVFMARWRRFELFLRERAQDGLPQDARDKALEMISSVGQYIAAFQPRRMPGNHPGDYEDRLGAIERELMYMDGVGQKLGDEISRRLAGLAEIRLDCPVDAGRGGGQTSLVAQLFQLRGLVETCALHGLPSHEEEARRLAVEVQARCREGLALIGELERLLGADEQVLDQWEQPGSRPVGDDVMPTMQILQSAHNKAEIITVRVGDSSVEAKNRAAALCQRLLGLKAQVSGEDVNRVTKEINRDFEQLAGLIADSDADMDRMDSLVREAREAWTGLEKSNAQGKPDARPKPPLVEARRQEVLARLAGIVGVVRLTLDQLWEMVYEVEDIADALFISANEADEGLAKAEALVERIEEHLADASACPDVIANRLEELRRRDAALRARFTGEPAAVPTESPALDEAREKLELIMFLLELAETYRGRIQEAVNDAGVCRNQAAEFAASRNCNLLRARYQQALQQGGIEQAREIVRQAANCGWAAEAGREIETARCQRLGQALFDACQGNNVERVRALLGQFESSSCRINADLMTRARALASGNATPDAPAPEMLRGNLDPEARSSLLDKHLRSKKLQSISFDSSDVAVARGASGQWELTGPVQCVIRLDWGAGYVQGLASYSKIYTLNFRPVRGLEALLEIGTLTESVSVSGSRKQTRQTSKAKTVQGALSQQGDGWVLGLPNGIAGVIGDVPYRLR